MLTTDLFPLSHCTCNTDVGAKVIYMLKVLPAAAKTTGMSRCKQSNKTTGLKAALAAPRGHAAPY